MSKSIYRQQLEENEKALAKLTSRIAEGDDLMVKSLVFLRDKKRALAKLRREHATLERITNKLRGRHTRQGY